MRLVLLRHGESVWNMENRFTGWTDVGLSQRGVEEAKKAGRILRDGGYEFDLCYTSYLKRAIHTLYHVLEEIDRQWLPIIKTWKLNERHYGALQGLNKAETAEKYGENQVKLWRRSFHVQPPALEKGDTRDPHGEAAYCCEPEAEIPLTESLKDTVARVIPYYCSEMKPQLENGKRILIVAHGNSLRALVKYLEKLSDEEIAAIDIPTGIPLVYELDEKFQVTGKRYLGDTETIEAGIRRAASQGRVKSGDRHSSKERII